MNIIFKKMIIDNFMSFDHQEFDFDSYDGITLITGINNDIPGSKNGCGKSSLINAFVFVLFGKMINQMSLKNVGNRHLPVRNTEVTLHLTANDVPYVIVSGIKMNSSAVGYCDVYKDSISKENKLSKHSIKETRLFIEKNIVETTFDVFLRSFVLTSDQFYNFFKMSKQDKRIFIENIFDTKIYGEMYRNIHRDNLDNEKSLVAVDTLVVSQVKDIVDMEEQVDNFEKTKNNEIDILTKKITIFKEQLDDKNTIKNKYDNKKLVDTLDLLQKTVISQDHKHQRLRMEIANKKNVISNLKTQHKEKIDYIKTYIDTYNQISEHSKPIIAEKLKLTDIKLGATKLVEQIKRETQNIKDLSKELSACVVPDKYTNKISQLKEVLKKLEQLNISIQQHTQDIEVAKRELNRVDSSPSAIKELLEKKKTDHDTNAKQLDGYINKKNILTFIESMVSEENIRRLVISDLIKLLNNQIQTYLISMGSDFTCMFDENLNYIFLTKNGETEYGSFSGGEKMRLSIAVSMAFRDFIVNRSGINSSVLILDEYVDSNIDDLAVKEIFKILREFNILYNQNVFVVSHREAVKLHPFDHVISIDKTDGISEISEQSGD